jgi:hypothetical protein
MGLAGYYRRFVEGFSKIANPITELQKKNKKFVWTEKCAEAFRRLKELLTTAPILKVPDMDADFLVCTDASKEGLGGVLMRDGRTDRTYKPNLGRHVAHVRDGPTKALGGILASSRVRLQQQLSKHHKDGAF